MIHRFHLDDWYIVVDTCSGSVHAVDEIAYEMIGAYEEKSREELIADIARRFGENPAEAAECYDQITALKEQGKLFAPDTFAPMAGELKQRTAGVVKALCRRETGVLGANPKEAAQLRALSNKLIAMTESW